ncbi:MAG: ABC transporter ATP-binding protein [Calditrichaceae bacterium]
MRYKKRLLFGFMFIVSGNFVQIINPQIIRMAIDYFKEDIVMSKLLTFAGLVILVTFVNGIFRFLMRRTVIVVSRFIENDLRNDLLTKLQTLSSTWFQTTGTGDIMSRLTNDLNSIRSVLGPGIMYSVNTFTTFVFVIIMMLKINSTLTMIALLPVPIMAVMVNRFGQQIHKRYLAVQNHFGMISTKAQENLAGMRIVKSYVLEESEIKDFNSLNKEYIKKNMDYARAYAGFHPSMMLIVGLSTAVILFFGGQLIIKNVITLGEFVAFSLYLGMLVWPSIALGWVAGIFMQGTAALKRLNHITQARPDIVDRPDVLTVKTIHGRVELKNLDFKYPGNEEQVLSDINLNIGEGQIIAVVGRTGSGKSTLIHLLTRTYNPPADTVFIDGNDIHRVPVAILREFTGYIPQDTFLFSDTIRNNIAFGVNDVSQEEIEWAARMAQMHDSIIEFPNGYDTILGERGINISGGQKQRISLARAILKHPRILLLDDALSAVDTVTEEAILTNLRTVMQDKTCLWVSHRISSIMNADYIIVLDNGRIIEQGTHDELLEINGLYADLFEKQQLEASLEMTE